MPREFLLLFNVVDSEHVPLSWKVLVGKNKVQDKKKGMFGRTVSLRLGNTTLIQEYELALDGEAHSLRVKEKNQEDIQMMDIAQFSFMALIYSVRLETQTSAETEMVQYDL